jgi:hypothetical protein
VLTSAAARSAAAFISDAEGEAEVAAGSASPRDPLHAVSKNAVKNNRKVMFRAITNVNVQPAEQISVDQPTEQPGF